ncbi:sortase [Patescibacteria group bacterium]|nr:sortase [Patescibacteria group bacterium]
MKTSLFKQYLRIFFLPIGLIVIGLLIAYLFLNAPALLKKFDYYYKTEIKKEDFTDNNFLLPSIDPNKPKNEQNSLGNLEDNHLYISSLNISAPIIWGIPEEQIIDNLKNGVVQFAGSNTPDGPGNVFITGHSSYYWWVRSDYKNVFALLPNIKKDGQIIITYKGEPYLYKVTEISTVKPSATDIINSRGKRETTLMTCVPVGTNISRFIVKAQLQNKDAAERNVPTPAETIDLLPKVN